MGFLADYVFYNSGNECPESFHIWSGLSLLSSVLSHKVYYNRDYFTVIPNIYTCLIGDAGSGKTTAMSIAKKILAKYFDTVPLSASVTSREDIGKFMGSPDGLRTYKKSDGSIGEYHPFCFFNSELENLLSVDLARMVAFLVDTYDGEYFSMSFKSTGKDIVPFPYTTMCSCSVPDYFMKALRIQVFTGGLGRRLLMVVDKGKPPIAHPRPPEGGEKALGRAVSHLKIVHDESFQGGFTMSREADRWWVDWYEGKDSPRRKRPDDAILSQLYSTKHVQVMKVAMLLAIEDYNPGLVLSVEHLQAALAMINLLEPKIKDFSLGVGRNELAAVAVNFLEMLHANDGAMPEKRMRARFFNECRVQGKEYDAMLEHLMKTDQIVVTDLDTPNGTRTVVLTPERYERLKNPKTPSSPSVDGPLGTSASQLPS